MDDYFDKIGRDADPEGFFDYNNDGHYDFFEADDAYRYKMSLLEEMDKSEDNICNDDFDPELDDDLDFDDDIDSDGFDED